MAGRQAEIRQDRTVEQPDQISFPSSVARASGMGNLGFYFAVSGINLVEIIY